MPRSDDGTLAPAEPVGDDGGEEELGNSSGGDEQEPVTPRVACGANGGSCRLGALIVSI